MNNIKIRQLLREIEESLLESMNQIGSPKNQKRYAKSKGNPDDVKKSTVKKYFKSKGIDPIEIGSFEVFTYITYLVAHPNLKEYKPEEDLLVTSGGMSTRVLKIIYESPFVQGAVKKIKEKMKARFGDNIDYNNSLVKSRLSRFSTPKKYKSVKEKGSDFGVQSITLREAVQEIVESFEIKGLRELIEYFERN